MALAGAHHPAQRVQRPRCIATVDRIGQLPGRNVARLPEERSDVVSSQAGPLAETRDERFQQRRQTSEIITEMGIDERCCRPVELHGRSVQLLAQPCASTLALLGYVGGEDVANLFDDRGQLGREAALVRGHEHHRGGRKGVREIVEQRLERVGGVGGDVAHHDHPSLGEERRGLRRVRCARGVAHIAVGTELLDHQREVCVTHQLVDELRHRLRSQCGILALDEVDGQGRRHAPAASSIAAMTSATWQAPRTSWARRMRQPPTMPIAWAAWLISRR